MEYAKRAQPHKYKIKKADFVPELKVLAFSFFPGFSFLMQSIRLLFPTT